MTHLLTPIPSVPAGFALAVREFGSQAEIARRFEISSAAVAKWRHAGVPADRAIEMEQWCCGRRSAREFADRTLVPDRPPPPPPPASDPMDDPNGVDVTFLGVD